MTSRLGGRCPVLGSGVDVDRIRRGLQPRGGGDRDSVPEPPLEPLEPLSQRAAGGVDLGTRTAQQRHLEGDRRLVTFTDLRERRGQHVNRAHDRGFRNAAGLVEHFPFVQHDEPDAGGDAVGGADDQKLSQVGDEVAAELNDVAGGATPAPR